MGAVLDLHKLLENRKASPESKMAVLEALGEISKIAGALKVSRQASVFSIYNSCSRRHVMSSFLLCFVSVFGSFCFLASHLLSLVFCPCMFLSCKEAIGHGRMAGSSRRSTTRTRLLCQNRSITISGVPSLGDRSIDRTYHFVILSFCLVLSCLVLSCRGCLRFSVCLMRNA